MFRSGLCLVLLGLSPVLAVVADAPAPRQYYSAWTKHSSRPYYYRSYFYKKSATDKEYAYHYGIYYPSRGKRVYMYNPHNRTYWGYWDGTAYSLLPREKRKASIDDIVAEDFPTPGKAPQVPDADDNILMIAPPSDFPKLDGEKP
jgi:hypothetical protein